MSEERNGVRILIVEDDPKIAKALSARLKHDGYSVAVAVDAVGAISEARKFSPDVAILDISMPGGDGFDVARRLDGVIHDRHLPKVFITASKSPGLRRKAVAAGAVAFVEKPFTAEQLRSALELATVPDGSMGWDDPPDTFA